jgi:hypothetical protein
MASIQPTVITNNAFNKGLSYDIKWIIIDKIPINKLILTTDTTVEPFIDTFIKYYIENKLFTNAENFTFLSQTILYKDIIDAKLITLATAIARDFIQQCKLFDERNKGANPLVDKKFSHLYFNINYYHGAHEQLYYNIFNWPKQKPIRSGYQYNQQQSLTLIRDDGFRGGWYMDEKNIIAEIILMFYHFLNPNYKGIYAIHSIEIIESTYTFTDINNIEDVPDINIIKKYY